ncbi:uncharacterized protein MONOS_11160 [Monocercomonoides exilis]|uniref:uncharacterized protein n=1 Tax=Monocercomonoides exilis TaxID=2049356 RepID=UPI0035595F40|nr:hypothetical protein MONOS_11160 [Monocercomonoides exilis]|eukprot:MONOS_11160.1-p1 / transcript=MONOS_11160.1 / gene=MONOS_11160 / organism=Monocercomonoides_exilis_PA203 / gene_product=unspecified product / transcript_product=unspecified product / location=Mono_scaffold00545:24277-25681(+) / protein_length=415 / sequence_SO=supercontig / SO=protein_coding / is_pseudo=false
MSDSVSVLRVMAFRFFVNFSCGSDEDIQRLLLQPSFFAVFASHLSSSSSCLHHEAALLACNIGAGTSSQACTLLRPRCVFALCHIAQADAHSAQCHALRALRNVGLLGKEAAGVIVEAGCVEAVAQILKRGRYRSVVCEAMDLLWVLLGQCEKKDNEEEEEGGKGEEGEKEDGYDSYATKSAFNGNWQVAEKPMGMLGANWKQPDPTLFELIETTSSSIFSQNVPIYQTLDAFRSTPSESSHETSENTSHSYSSSSSSSVGSLRYHYSSPSNMNARNSSFTSPSSLSSSSSSSSSHSPSLISPNSRFPSSKSSSLSQTTSISSTSYPIESSSSNTFFFSSSLPSHSPATSAQSQGFSSQFASNSSTATQLPPSSLPTPRVSELQPPFSFDSSLYLKHKTPSGLAPLSSPVFIRP